MNRPSLKEKNMEKDQEGNFQVPAETSKNYVIGPNSKMSNLTGLSGNYCSDRDGSSV